ncbi:MAG TPA: MaoC/PaaZ C-terminal domain-containing protein [Thermoleophilaceae bacterium]|nr:MaoC/PaaZ C-terminal domain-containing protein [Thermoleophilaceae bacterium]
MNVPTLSVGDEAPTVRLGPITRTDIVRYAGAGGDFNPIHHDEEFARAAGVPSVFAMGLMHAGMLAQHLAGWVGQANVRAFGVRFTGQVWPGDVLSLDGRVERVDEGPDGRRALCAMKVSRQDGDAAITARAVVACA